MDDRSTPMTAGARASTPVERVYFAWNDALSRNDAAALLALYAENTHFESPLVPHLLGGDSGVLRGPAASAFRDAGGAQAAGAAILSHRLSHRRQAPDLGIPARRGTGRADGFRRGDG